MKHGRFLRGEKQEKKVDLRIWFSTNFDVVIDNEWKTHCDWNGRAELVLSLPLMVYLYHLTCLSLSIIEAPQHRDGCPFPDGDG